MITGIFLTNRTCQNLGYDSEAAEPSRQPDSSAAMSRLWGSVHASVPGRLWPGRRHERAGQQERAGWKRRGAAAGNDDVGMRRKPLVRESDGSGSAFSPVPAVRPARAWPSPPLPSASGGREALVSPWGWPFCRGCLQIVARAAEVLRAGPAVGAMAAGKPPAVLDSGSPRKPWRVPADGHPAPGCYLRWATRSYRQQRRWVCSPRRAFCMWRYIGSGRGERIGLAA